MKRFFIASSFIILAFNCWAQKIDLENIIKDSYIKPSDQAVLSNKNVCYIIPSYIKFIDTINSRGLAANRIKFFESEQAFGNYLNESSVASLINVTFNEVSNDKMIVTLEILDITREQYFGQNRFWTFVDKRKIKLKLNDKKTRWIVDKLIQIYPEPVAGGQ